MQFPVMSNSLGSDGGMLTFAGRRVDVLAAKYGTPLIMYDERVLRERCRTYRRAVQAGFPAGSTGFYANKAFCCSVMFRLLEEEGMSVDCASGGELYAALHAGFPAERICLHGNNKLSGELELALDAKVGCVCVDNETELDMLQALCARRGCAQKITLRVTPGIDAHTFQKVLTGAVDSKFGIPIAGGGSSLAGNSGAAAAVRKAAGCANLRLAGIQCHIGSQIPDTDPYIQTAALMLEIMAGAEADGIHMEELTLGGGFGIKYVDGQESVDIAATIARLAEFMHSECARLGLAIPRVNFEPGRSVVGDAALTLYTVGNVRASGVDMDKIYVAIDGGMTDNPRYELYGAPYTVLNASKIGGALSMRNVTLAGKLCESGDIIQERLELPQTGPGDLIAVLCTGAYNYAMASNYNKIPRPAVIFADDDCDRHVIKRETYEDMLRLDI